MSDLIYVMLFGVILGALGRVIYVERIVPYLKRKKAYKKRVATRQQKSVVQKRLKTEVEREQV